LYNEIAKGTPKCLFKSLMIKNENMLYNYPATLKCRKFERAYLIGNHWYGNSIKKSSEKLMIKFYYPLLIQVFAKAN